MKKVFFLFVLAVMAVSCSNNKLNAPDMPVSQDVVASSPNPVFVWYDAATKLAKMDFAEVKEYMNANEWFVRVTDSTLFTKILNNGVTIHFDFAFAQLFPDGGNFSGSIINPDTAMSVEDVRTAVTKIGSSIVMNGYHVDYMPDYPYWYDFSLLTEHPSFEENVSWIGQDPSNASSIVWNCQESQDIGQIELIFHWNEIDGKKYISYIHFNVNVPGKEDLAG